MDKQLSIERDPLPEEFASLTEAGAFWDTHSTADYEDVMEDVAFEVNLTGKPTYYFAVAKDIATALHDVAQQQGVSTQTLINLWLQEKLIFMTN
jgi:CopG antitoxin of type II toxin-antitoxin system